MEKNVRNRLARLFLALCGVLLALTTAELAGRVYARLFSQQRVSTIDDLRGWKLVANARSLYRKDAQPYLIVINSKGLRDRQHTYEKPPGVFRIVVMGDSFVFGSGGVEARARFTDILERTMKNVEVINMGIPAYGTDQEYLYLKTEGLKYHPDLVILCAYRNDFNESFETMNPANGRPKGYLSVSGSQLVFHPPTFSFFYKLSQWSYVAGVVDFAASEVLNKIIKRRWRVRLALTPQERSDTFKKILISTEDLCRDRGAEFLMVYFPFPDQQSKNGIQQAMNELAATRGTRILDLMDHMREVDSQKLAYIPGDIHFSEYGHQVVAKAIQEYLVTTGIANSRVLQAQQPPLARKQ